jgi:hypothetical protein
MTATTMRLRPAERRLPRLAALALLLFAPKCLVCAATYAGLGTALGLGGPELCGAPPDHDVRWLLLGVPAAGFAAKFLFGRTGAKTRRPAIPS